jgi:S-adenosylmethionine:tRNA ribosyltransferase-isomerase
MLTSEFDYDLPSGLIAQKPLPERDASRMMVLRRREKEIVHSQFKEFPSFLDPGDVLVLNDSKVIPAKVWGRRGPAQIEFLFLGEKEPGLWGALCRPAKKARLGDRITFPSGLEAEVAGWAERGKRLLRFGSAGIQEKLKKIGYAPLPPYIKRRASDSNLRNFDLARYQTVFARREGSIAAPTAGLHFTPRILKGIEMRGVFIHKIALDVGQATFEPVRTIQIEDHPMRSERFTVSSRAARAVNKAKADGRPVVAVGTTVVRTLESAWKEGLVRAGTRLTSLFIYPGYRFQAVGSLLTNFHLPRSTLLMLVSAFAGVDLIRRAYAEAVSEKYRFYSYGDCMLII